jgi:hypothetical protein
MQNTTDWPLALAVLDVLEQHGYPGTDHMRAGRAARMVGKIAATDTGVAHG